MHPGQTALHLCHIRQLCCSQCSVSTLLEALPIHLIAGLIQSYFQPVLLWKCCLHTCEATAHAESCLPCLQVRQLLSTSADVDEAGPSDAVQMFGLSAVPKAGDEFVTHTSLEQASPSSLYLSLLPDLLEAALCIHHLKISPDFMCLLFINVVIMSSSL